MSAADHPSMRGRRCGCGQPVRARVAWPQLPGTDPAAGFAIVRPLTNPNPIGELLCTDCVHAAVDVMLMRAQPERAR